MNQYLKTKRERRREKLLIILFAIYLTAVVLIVGSMDYQDAVRLDVEKRIFTGQAK